MTTAAEKNSAAPDKRRALGRGLESLLPGPRPVAPPPAPVAHVPAVAPPPIEKGAPLAQHPPGDEVREIALDRIDDNPHQTRYHFDQKTLQDLAESITANGVVQPIVVRPSVEGRYVLVLGERRCRASKLAGKEKIPAIVRTVSDQQAAEMTVVENLQRHDLNCIEQANAFAKLSREFGLTQEQIGKRTGVSRETVSNYMRLLKLPALVTQYLQEGRLGFSEARVLLTLLDANLIPKIAEEAVQKHLSVQQLEDLVFATNVPVKKERHSDHRARWVDPNVRAAQTELERVLGTRVRIRDRKGKGKIVIEYGTLEDFDRVLEILAGKSHSA
jgi:ParB family transcriptional regulator, chromosome partitioning protein